MVTFTEIVGLRNLKLPVEADDARTSCRRTAVENLHVAFLAPRNTHRVLQDEVFLTRAGVLSVADKLDIMVAKTLGELVRTLTTRGVRAIKDTTAVLGER